MERRERLAPDRFARKCGIEGGRGECRKYRARAGGKKKGSCSLLGGAKISGELSEWPRLQQKAKTKWACRLKKDVLRATN